MLFSKPLGVLGENSMQWFSSMKTLKIFAIVFLFPNFFKHHEKRHDSCEANRYAFYAFYVVFAKQCIPLG